LWVTQVTGLERGVVGASPSGICGKVVPYNTVLLVVQPNVASPPPPPRVARPTRALAPIGAPNAIGSAVTATEPPMISAAAAELPHLNPSSPKEIPPTAKPTVSNGRRASMPASTVTHAAVAAPKVTRSAAPIPKSPLAAPSASVLPATAAAGVNGAGRSHVLARTNGHTSPVKGFGPVDHGEGAPPVVSPSIKKREVVPTSVPEGKRFCLLTWYAIMAPHLRKQMGVEMWLEASGQRIDAPPGMGQ
jgi:hypothetical protein